MDSLDSILDTFSLAAVCLLLLIKAAGIPVPIPGDLILLATAARAVEGKLILWQAFVAILVAVVAGGTVQFFLARGPGRGLVYRLARFAGLEALRMDAFAEVVRRRGPLSLLLALLTPGVRNLTVPACGLAGLSWRAFVPPLLIATAVDLILHFALGAVGGSILQVVQPDPLALLAAVVVLAAVGLTGWWLINRNRRRSTSRAGTIAAWESTACPVCLLMGALGAPASAMPINSLHEVSRVQL